MKSLVSETPQKIKLIFFYLKGHLTFPSIDIRPYFLFLFIRTHHHPLCSPLVCTSPRHPEPSFDTSQHPRRLSISRKLRLPLSPERQVHEPKPLHRHSPPLRHDSSVSGQSSSSHFVNPGRKEGTDHRPVKRWGSGTGGIKVLEVPTSFKERKSWNEYGIEGFH